MKEETKVRPLYPLIPRLPHPSPPMDFHSDGFLKCVSCKAAQAPDTRTCTSCGAQMTSTPLVIRQGDPPPLEIPTSSHQRMQYAVRKSSDALGKNGVTCVGRRGRGSADGGCSDENPKLGARLTRLERKGSGRQALVKRKAERGGKQGKKDGGRGRKTKAQKHGKKAEVADSKAGKPGAGPKKQQRLRQGYSCIPCHRLKEKCSYSQLLHEKSCGKCERKINKRCYPDHNCYECKKIIDKVRSTPCNRCALVPRVCYITQKNLGPSECLRTRGCRKPANHRGRCKMPSPKDD